MATKIRNNIDTSLAKTMHIVLYCCAGPGGSTASHHQQQLQSRLTQRDQQTRPLGLSSKAALGYSK